DVAVAFQLAEIIQFAGNDVRRQAAEFPEDLQLKFLGHPRKLRRGGGREDDLKRAHRMNRIIRPDGAVVQPLNSYGLWFEIAPVAVRKNSCSGGEISQNTDSRLELLNHPAQPVVKTQGAFPPSPRRRSRWGEGRGEVCVPQSERGITRGG